MPFHHLLERHDHDEAVDLGKSLRTTLKRSRLAEPSTVDRDVVALIRAQHVDRIPELVPLRLERMGSSPFAFFRATADIMTTDLASTPVTGVDVVISGDAHIGNFGFYASPERRILFDLNDFDESGVGPWEWDLKRLVVSAVVCARGAGADHDEQRALAEQVAAGYRTAIRHAAGESVLDRYYRSVDAEELADTVPGSVADVIDKALTKARKRTADQIVEKITEVDNTGRRRITPDPPIVVPLTDTAGRDASEQPVAEIFERYLSSVRTDVALLLSQFEVTDVARRVVGVGSVGNVALIVLLQGPSDEPMVLQLKEAAPSVLETNGGLTAVIPETEQFPADARDAVRVVAAAHVLQANSDPFLGWTANENGAFYWRQFRDMKGSIDADHLSPGELRRYSVLCAQLLARAHSQSPAFGQIAGYLGRKPNADKAIGRWSVDYADVVDDDFRVFQSARADGAFDVE
ncbi:DUF2252 domain-containing protein [Williamsia sterculiae]|uniref:Uncharacterized conserved protein, DUF2252 family n=1 Tax=Williamsia sterculiae TaxID=1344003 RepID=A0A1N7HCW8_9NOCA|nr:DUF2252 domain-containing protein [Williamsia sterculiae]SIS22528.1 Uncharacterized conserved protein, DUF2252 family [Williamsia sterculiae]